MTDQSVDQSSLRWAWEKALRGTDIPLAAYAVAMMLSTYADKRGSCFPSVSTLAKDLHTSTRNVQDQLRVLKEVGWIAAVERPGTSSIYQLVIAQSPVHSLALEAKRARARRSKAVSEAKAETYAEIRALVKNLKFEPDEGTSNSAPLPTSNSSYPPAQPFVPGTSNSSSKQTKEENKNKPDKHPMHQLDSETPPSGVTTEEWEVCRPFLNGVVGAIGEKNGKRLVKDWPSLTAKSELCHSLAAVARIKNRRALIDSLTDGDYTSAKNVAVILLDRVRKVTLQTYPYGVPDFENSDTQDFIATVVASLGEDFSTAFKVEIPALISGDSDNGSDHDTPVED